MYLDPSSARCYTIQDFDDNAPDLRIVFTDGTALQIEAVACGDCRYKYEPRPIMPREARHSVAVLVLVSPAEISLSSHVGDSRIKLRLVVSFYLRDFVIAWSLPFSASGL